MTGITAMLYDYEYFKREILALTGASLAEVLLSKYYWRGQLETQAGHPADFAQYTFKALEELERLEDVDWSLVERLYNVVNCGLEG